jgi:hypothetical protein
VATLREALRAPAAGAPALPVGLAASWASGRPAGSALLLRLAAAAAPLQAPPPPPLPPLTDAALFDAFARGTAGRGEAWASAAASRAAAAPALAAAALLRAVGSPTRAAVDAMAERLRHGEGGRHAPWVGEGGGFSARFAGGGVPPPPPSPTASLRTRGNDSSVWEEGGGSGAATPAGTREESPPRPRGEAPAPRAPAPETIAAFERAMAIGLGSGGGGAPPAPAPAPPAADTAPDRAAASSSYLDGNATLRSLLEAPLGAALATPVGGAVFARAPPPRPPLPPNLARANPPAEGEARRAAALVAAEASGRGDGSVALSRSASVSVLSEALLG